jgi:hypothetical protein
MSIYTKLVEINDCLIYNIRKYILQVYGISENFIDKYSENVIGFWDALVSLNAKLNGQNSVGQLNNKFSNDDVITFRKKVVEASSKSKKTQEAELFLQLWEILINWQKENGLYTERLHALELYDEELVLLRQINQFYDIDIKNNLLIDYKNKTDQELLRIIHICTEILEERRKIKEK